MPATPQQPVGIPVDGQIVINGGADHASDLAVTVETFCRNAEYVQLFETGQFDADGDWEFLGDEDGYEHTYTFSAVGEKTLFAAFKNPSGYTIGADESISASITIVDTVAVYPSNADLYDSNIQKSINKRIKTFFEDVYGYPVDYGDALFKPGSEDRWIDISWVEFGRGAYTTNSFMIRCHGLVASDRYKTELEKMVGRLKAALNVSSVPFYDFTDPANPVQLTYDGEAMVLYLRYDDRSNAEFAQDSGSTNEGPTPGVDTIPLVYNVYAPRPTVIN